MTALVIRPARDSESKTSVSSPMARHPLLGRRNKAHEQAVPNSRVALLNSHDYGYWMPRFRGT
jgi:hypothetical protein